MYNNRKPIKRIRGRYEGYPEGIEEFAKKVANDLCDQFPDTDILDLENVFNRWFGYHLSRRLGKESIEETES